MNLNSHTEHFVTLFDSHYLPQGLCLHRSLEQHSRPYHLWIVAVDDACANALTRLALANVTVVRLHEIEDDALRSVKGGRSVGEYCWTLTPFLPSYVFARLPELKRVTYVDADLYFFEPPAVLLEEFERSAKHVLITEHAFAPEYASHARFGRFCVQFVTFRNSEPARRVLAWWQARCIEWCFAREEDGKFGDQKYLDLWPDMFAKEVHVLAQTDRTLAPWNVLHFSRSAGRVRPVFYHFHGLKIVSPTKVALFYMYRIGRRNRWIYDQYVGALRSMARTMRRLSIPVVGRALMGGEVGILSFAKSVMKGEAGWASI
jgi:hypothetical protein